ncbi:hypothetical protein C5167_016652 [Papaver somniferum]|nr:hypothetical protein C5167_016652 [Papaver somniferum]
MGASSSSFLEESVYDFTVKDKTGNDVDLSIYKGKVLLFVNVASNCGLTDVNYTQLSEIYTKYKDQGLEVLAFPCNQFLKQEPKSAQEVEQFVCTRFKAEFPVFHKVMNERLFASWCCVVIELNRIQFVSKQLGELDNNIVKSISEGVLVGLKVRVNGTTAAPVFKFLKSKSPGSLGSRVKWNFTKFLVDREGRVIGRYAPTTPPFAFEKDIQNALESKPN